MADASARAPGTRALASAPAKLSKGTGRGPGVIQGNRPGTGCTTIPVSGANRARSRGAAGVVAIESRRAIGNTDKGTPYPAAPDDRAAVTAPAAKSGPV